jgi:hypothetical protein
VNSLNEQAMRLFEREGYTSIRKIWRIVVGSNDSHDSVEKSSRDHADKADLDIDSQRLVDATPLYDRDGVYIIREYVVYEKELRAGERLPVSLEDELQVLMPAG